MGKWRGPRRCWPRRRPRRVWRRPRCRQQRRRIPCHIFSAPRARCVGLSASPLVSGSAHPAGSCTPPATDAARTGQALERDASLCISALVAGGAAKAVPEVCVMALSSPAAFVSSATGTHARSHPWAVSAGSHAKPVLKRAQVPTAKPSKEFFHRALLGAVGLNRRKEEKHYEHW